MTIVDNGPADVSRLTCREAEVLLLLAEGDSNRVLARRLGIAERTLRAHITSLTRKLGVRSRLQAALFAHSHRDTLAAGGEAGESGARIPE
ncbi:helix-turn-helix domain-containing protein [Streptomyces tubercidicus]|nr:helix-turn-helix transcriptional regulator [Streptomyces tubercidicus]WAU16496.1 helix-turn-helix transcriptional regulator [Streptomyces tubercidicus]